MDAMTERLPQRPGPRPPTHQGMPHTQIGVSPIPEVNAELFRRSFSLPGVENRPTIISVPGARALWLDDTVAEVRPGVILAGREFAHIHPDGSMHLTLPAERARAAITAGWAEVHPIARQVGVEGMVLVYTPRTFEELEVLWSLVVDAYSHVTGRPRPVIDPTS
jgi:phospholipase/carboxylesterase